MTKLQRLVIRLNKYYTQSEIANLVGVTQPTINRIKKGSVKNPCYLTVNKLIKLDEKARGKNVN